MNGNTPIPWRRDAYFSTGRDALCALLAAVCARPARRRLWIPGYYCPDVVRTLLSLARVMPLELRTYPAPPPGPPDLARIPHAPGDLLLLVNLFGLHGAATTPLLAAGASPAPAQASAAADRRRRFPAGTLPPGVMLIEDHTHDPLSLWARTSAADWCFASLRKTLPLPDGGVVWSPSGRALPRPPALTLQRRLASLEMLAAMTLRRDQAAGGTAAAETIRELELKAEARLQSGAVSGMPPWTREMLEGLPVAEIRRRRLAAHQQLGAALDATADRAPEVRLLRPAAAVGAADGCGPAPTAGRGRGPADACPYPAVLEFARPAARRRAQRLLENAGVETLLLWPLGREGLPDAPTAEELDFSGRMLAVLRLNKRLAQRGPGEAARVAALLSGGETKIGG